MKLHARARIPFAGDSFVARIEPLAGPWTSPQRSRAAIADQYQPSSEIPTVFSHAERATEDGAIFVPQELPLGEGDIVRVNPTAQEVHVLFRKSSRSNSLFVTERCDCRCMMCPQPPRVIDDAWRVDELLEVIRLIDPETTELGITGGEPTLLGGRLVDLLAAIAKRLPGTAVHLLSNGRRFGTEPWAVRLAESGITDLMVGIPLYGDTAAQHDFVMQSRGAFSDTVRGILNLAAAGVRIELRVVLHRETYQRLPHIARFISRSLPFVQQVAFMGLEPMGYAKANRAALWIDPRDYAPQLEAAVMDLRAAQIRALVFNLPHCLLPRSLWPEARQSISDWKIDFSAVCNECAALRLCSGVFQSGRSDYSPLLTPLRGVDS